MDELQNRSSVPGLEENTSNQPVQLQNLARASQGWTIPYMPTTTASNYDPTNMENPANQQHLRPGQTHVSSSENRAQGYTYKSDQAFIEQMKAQKGQPNTAPIDSTRIMPETTGAETNQK